MQPLFQIRSKIRIATVRLLFAVLNIDSPIIKNAGLVPSQPRLARPPRRAAPCCAPPLCRNGGNVNFEKRRGQLMLRRTPVKQTPAKARPPEGYGVVRDCLCMSDTGNVDVISRARRLPTRGAFLRARRVEFSL